MIAPTTGRKGRAKSSTLLLPLLLVLFTANAGFTGSFETFGGDPASAATVGADTVATDSTAVFSNPASLAMLEHPQLSAGLWSGATALTIDGEKQQVDDPDGILVSAATPLGDNTAFGFLAYLPLGPLVESSILPPDRTGFVLFRNRFTVPRLALSCAWRPHPFWSLGAGVQIAAAATVNTLAALYISNYRDPQNEDPDFYYSTVTLNMKLENRIAPILSLLFAPPGGFRAALVYHEKQQVPIDAAVDVEVEVGGILRVIVPMLIDGSLFYEPRHISLSSGWQRDRLSLFADLSWYQWSKFRDPRIVIETLPSENNPPIFRTYPDAKFEDRLVPRLGAGWKTGERGIIRAGYSYVKSPVPDQKGPNNLADCDRHVFAAGAGWILSSPAERRTGLHADLFAQYHVLSDREVNKDDPLLDGPDYRLGGHLWVTGLSVTMALPW